VFGYRGTETIDGACQVSKLVVTNGHKVNRFLPHFVEQQTLRCIRHRGIRNEINSPVAIYLELGRSPRLRWNIGDRDGRRSLLCCWTSPRRDRIGHIRSRWRAGLRLPPTQPPHRTYRRTVRSLRRWAGRFPTGGAFP
jgi:hypothetical protein